jgi:hypothetical protein
MGPNDLPSNTVGKPHQVDFSAACKSFCLLVVVYWLLVVVSIRDYFFTLWAGRKFCQA